RAALAAVDTATGALTPWVPTGLGGRVDSIATANGRVYLAGSLRSGPTSLTDYALAYDATTGDRYGEWSPRPNRAVALLQARGSTIYAAGSFTTVNGEPRRYLAALDADDGTLHGWDPSPDETVSTLALVDGNLVVGGGFNEIAGQTRLRIAAFDGSDALSPWSVAASGPVQAIAETGSYTYVGGDFHSVGGTIRHNLAALDGGGNLLPWAPDPDDTVHALLVDGSRIAAGGLFTTAAGQPRRGLAAFDTTSGALLSWAPSVDGDVHSLLAHGGSLYVGGWFSSVDGQPRSGLAAFDLGDGRLTSYTVDVGFGPISSPLSGVRSMAVLGGSLYLGGLFTAVNGTTRWSLAAVDATSGALLPWNPEAIGDGRPVPQGRISTLQAGGGTVYVGGAFRTGAGDQTNAAALDAVTGARSATLPSSTFPTTAMLLDGSTLYLDNDTLKALDLTTGLPSWEVQPYGDVFALSLAGTRLDAGGGFNSIGLAPTSGYARFDD
ncbi:MAG TPA: PQQ-binding-like beta-propeller repeat protein, partial [Conexibacter sp.]|nr:PQQ-binding-like beta-propeller repeat protein [Conexibacter sp.]